MWKRIVGIFGAILAFAAAAVAYITGTASAGDVVYVEAPAAAVQLTAQQKQSVGAAVSATWAGSKPADLDMAHCWQHPVRQPGVWQCYACQAEAALTDEQYADLDLAGSVRQSTSGTVKCLDIVTLTADMETAWGAAADAIGSAPLDSFAWFRVFRSDPENLSTVSVEYSRIKAVNATQYRADKAAGKVVVPIGRVQQ